MKPIKVLCLSSAETGERLSCDRGNLTRSQFIFTCNVCCKKIDYYMEDMYNVIIGNSSHYTCSPLCSDMYIFQEI